MDIYNKNVIVIGSGHDLNGRALGKKIDSDLWDIVVRCNKPYGRSADVGTRLDLIATRYRSWVNKFFGPVQPCEVVAFNEQYNISAAEYKAIMAEISWSAVSCGLLAAAWCLNRGASNVSVIGMGFFGGLHRNEKIYDNGQRDKNPLYHWAREAQWMKNNCIVL